MISVSQHEKNLRELPCAVSRMTPVTLHHCHGGSMKSEGWHVGTGQRQNPYLQIPLHAKYHLGSFGVDAGLGVETWESHFGAQTDLLDWVRSQLGYDVWTLATEWERENRQQLP